MTDDRTRVAALILCLGALLAGCRASHRVQLPAQRPSAPTATSDEATAAARGHVEAGCRALQRDHPEQARREFDRALVLLRAASRQPSDPRLGALLDRIGGCPPGFVLLAGSVEGRSSDPTLLADLLAATAVDPPVAEPEVLIETAPAAGPELQIPLEPRVLHELEQFQGRLRGDLHDALRRARPYLPLVTQVLREEGLPLDLAYIPLVESAFDPQATSRTQAKGLWQLVGGTARSLGLRQDAGVDERNDPEKSTRAAARYLSQLVETFQGDWLLALAGYNAGPARVREAIRRSGRHDFWALSRTDEFLPQQTRTYVPKVLAAILIGRAPSHYGFDVDPSTP